MRTTFLFRKKTSLNKEKLLLFLMIVFLISSASAVCTITLDKASYSPTETVTAEISCSEATEKSKDYSINWSFNGVDNYEWDLGTTPSTTGENCSIFSPVERGKCQKAG